MHPSASALEPSIDATCPAGQFIGKQMITSIPSENKPTVQMEQPSLSVSAPFLVA